MVVNTVCTTPGVGYVRTRYSSYDALLITSTFVPTVHTPTYYLTNEYSYFFLKTIDSARCRATSHRYKQPLLPVITAAIVVERLKYQPKVLIVGRLCLMMQDNVPAQPLFAPSSGQNGQVRDQWLNQ